MAVTIGMDVGGTNVVAGLFDENGKLVRRDKIRTEKTRGAEGLIAQLAELCLGLLDKEGWPRDRLGAVGLGLPGFIDREAGTVKAANLPLDDTPVAKLLREKLGISTVTVQNDVKMIVYGESLRGAGEGAKHVLGLTLGTGLACGWVTEGRLHDGAGGLAGEVGHIAYPDIPYVCGCGMTGCLETVASATGVARQARAGLEAGRTGLLADRFPEGRRGELTARDVYVAYADGDSFAGEVFEKTAGYLSRVVSAAVALLSPDVIVVGGGVAAAGDALFEPLVRDVKASLHPLYHERLKIVPPTLGEDAGLYGSAEFARNHLS